MLKAVSQEDECNNLESTFSLDIYLFHAFGTVNLLLTLTEKFARVAAVLFP